MSDFDETAPDLPVMQNDTTDPDEEIASKTPVKESPEETSRILEALLFASQEILPAARLKTILPGEPDGHKIRKMVDNINIALQKQRHPFEIVELGGGYQVRTISYYYPWVRQLFKDKNVKKLSVQALECLAIIAYKQPITKAEIEAIRGVLSDGAMKTLLERRMVTISGRSEKPGRPLTYGTTKEFLTYFGINKIEDLPSIEEFEALAKEKIGEIAEFSSAELQNELFGMKDSSEEPLPTTLDQTAAPVEETTGQSSISDEQPALINEVEPSATNQVPQEEPVIISDETTIIEMSPPDDSIPPQQPTV